MTSKIFRSTLLVAVLVLICSLSVVMGVLYKHFTGVQVQQLKAELQAKTNEAIGLAGDKAREMGLEAKAKYVLEYAKGMILNNSAEIPPDVHQQRRCSRYSGLIFV